MLGTIKKLYLEKGFGFIRIEGERDFFFHVRDCDAACFVQGKKLAEGQQVSFEGMTCEKGPRAVKIIPAT